MRCDWCEVRWPDDVRYQECPQCRERTRHAFSQPTITTDDAEATASEWAFGWWLWDTERL